MPETTKTEPKTLSREALLLILAYTVICHLAGIGVALLIFNLMDC